VLATLLTLCGFLFIYCPQVPATPRSQVQDPISDAEQALFIKGQNLYNQGLYHEAIAVFSDFLKVYPHSQIQDLTLLWLGRSHLRLGDFASAERIGSRLREIPDTAFLGIYDEELRVARRTYVKSAGLAARPETPTKAEGLKVGPEVSKLSTTSTVPPKTAATTAGNVATVRSQSDAPNTLPIARETKGPIVEQPKRANTGTLPSPTTISNGPLVRIRLEQNPHDAVINDVSFYRLLVVNEGKGVAKDLVVSELLSEDSQFASSYPAPSSQDSVGRTQRLNFRLTELKPGESRMLRIAVRPRAAGHQPNPLNSKHSVSYQDLRNKSYRSE